MKLEAAAKTTKVTRNENSPRPNVKTAIPPDGILLLQRTIGNQSVLRLLRSEISHPADKHELQTEQIAATEMRMGEEDIPKGDLAVLGEPEIQHLCSKCEQDTDSRHGNALPDVLPLDLLEGRLRPVEQGLVGFLTGAGSVAVQRRCGSSCDCSACIATGADRLSKAQPLVALQRLIDNRATGRLLAAQSVKTVISGSGEELEPAMRNSMEQRFGIIFSDVRVHRDAAAAASAKALGAHAYTVGTHIVFAPGRYDSSSIEGQQTLAHELVHVIQQRNGPVPGIPIGDGVSVSQPNDPFERAAEDKASEVMATAPESFETKPVEVATAGNRPTTVDRLAIQRDDDSYMDGASERAVEQIATDDDISYLEEIIEEAKQAGPDQAQEQETAQAVWVQPLVVQRWSVWTCFGDKANIAAALAAIGVSAVSLLAPEPTTLTKLAGIAGILGGIAWLISAIFGLSNCYRAQDDAAQHQQEIDSLQRQIDQLQRTQRQIQQAGGGSAPAPAPAPSGE